MKINWRLKSRRSKSWIALLALVILPAAAALAAPPIGVRVTLQPGVVSAPVTGRVFLFVTRDARTEPRLVAPYTYAYYLRGEQPWAFISSAGGRPWV